MGRRSDVLRRGLLLTFAGVTAFAVLLPLAEAQEPLPAHVVTVIEASMRLYQEPSHETIIENDSIDGQECSGTQRFDFDKPNRAFTFEEGQTSGDCAEAQITLQVPVGAESIVVNFTANRTVTSTGGLPLQPNMRQEFRLRSPLQGTIGQRAYFEPQAGSSIPLNFSVQYPLSSNTTLVTLGWFFQDQGADLLGEKREYGHVLAATVTNISVTWPDIALRPPSIFVGEEEEREEDRLGVARVLVNVTVPDLAPIIVGTTTGLRLTVAAGPQVVGVQGPQGSIDPDGLSLVEAGRRLVISLNESVVTQHGFGSYSFDFLTARALAPLPVPSPPTRVYAVFWTLLLLPIPASVLATYSANAYRREAEGPYLRTARIVLGIIIALVVYYVIIGLYALLGVGPRTMATVPPTNVSLLLYAQLLLVLVLLVGIAILQARARTGAMRRDIEERRRKEDRLRRSNEELERFAYVASHDLQEPLRKVAGFTALLQKRYAGRLDKDADEIIQYAVDGASRMQMLIKDILAYSRVGSKELDRVPVDANRVMEQVVADLERPISETQAEVRWRDLPTVRADMSQLRQVLQNLVENAIKYRHPKRRPKVEVSATTDEKAWHFAVRDNGQGIPADKHEEIFGIFRRLHGQSTPGTGIGLAVAKKAVERHDGRIWVQSTPGKGSTFHFLLPRSLLDARAPLVQAADQPEGSSAAAAV